jgi:ABC-type antimicrobial peptide transport system permease subunit
VDPTVAALDVHRYRDLLVGSLEGRRNLVLLFGLLGAVAVVMAAVGVFGVLAFWVGRQRREIGVRMAVGAGRTSVQRHVLRRGLAPVAAGLALGLAGAVALGGFMESLIFGVRPVDPPTLAAVAALLAAVSALAIWVPARRAARVDPVSVLNGE